MHAHAAFYIFTFCLFLFYVYFLFLFALYCIVEDIFCSFYHWTFLEGLPCLCHYLLHLYIFLFFHFIFLLFNILRFIFIFIHFYITFIYDDRHTLFLYRLMHYTPFTRSFTCHVGWFGCLWPKTVHHALSVLHTHYYLVFLLPIQVGFHSLVTYNFTVLPPPPHHHTTAACLLVYHCHMYFTGAACVLGLPLHTGVPTYLPHIHLPPIPP